MKSFFIDPKKLNPIEEFDNERVNWLKDKIQNEGHWFKPIAISKEHNLVMDGHHRLEVALRLDFKRVPCFIFSYIDVVPYSLRDNIEISSEIIINNFLNSIILPYKTAKHELTLPTFTPVELIKLEK